MADSILAGISQEETLQEVLGRLTRFNNQTGVEVSNVRGVVRTACEIYPDPDIWATPSIADGDLILQRGNTSGAGWIEISRSPFTKDTETTLTLAQQLYMPLKLTYSVSLTHRNAGEHVASVEVISDDVAYGSTPLDAPVAVPILNASQSTTTITINFASPPTIPFRVGQVVSVYGFTDTRLNVNSCTVASTPNKTRITIVGNDYTLTSTTIASTLGNGNAFVERYDLLSLARNGVAMVYGSATATQQRFYIRSQGGVALPSGTLAGSHQITTNTDTATALASTAPYSESWAQPSDTILHLSREAVSINDRTTNSTGNITNRLTRNQVIPNPIRPYLLQFKVRATPSLTRPIGKIVSISKSGTTTTTITLEEDHDLVTGQYVGFYGARDQTNFANQTTGLICTVTGARTLTVTHGTAATATSYGGLLMRVHGQQVLGGAIAQVAQTVSRIDNEVVLGGNATWAAPTAVGNLVELIGCRENGTGADLGLDGTYCVAEINTVTLRLSSVPGVSPTGANIITTNCGGAVVQRFGMRIHGVTTIDYDPFLIEPKDAGSTISTNAQPVYVTASATIASNVGTVTPLMYADTATALAAAATFTGTSRDGGSTFTYQKFVANSVASHDGTLYIDRSIDGTTWYVAAKKTCLADEPVELVVLCTNRYHRVRYVNGATLQTSFRLTSAYHRI